jgi:hypothetical protein
MIDRRDVWTNSTGSSIVMMLDDSFELMWLTMAARVVDLPEPVVPVTSTIPRGRSASRLRTSGRPSSSRVAIRVGMCRKTSE